MRKYTNKDRWRHINHFVDTHPYSEDNLDYLNNWIAHFEDVGVAPRGNATPTKRYDPVSDEANRYENISDNSLSRTVICPQCEIEHTNTDYEDCCGAVCYAIMKDWC